MTWFGISTYLYEFLDFMELTYAIVFI
jgi:hypothetical protein